jgi:hypothetical protein
MTYKVKYVQTKELSQEPKPGIITIFNGPYEGEIDWVTNVIRYPSRMTNLKHVGYAEFMFSYTDEGGHNYFGVFKCENSNPFESIKLQCKEIAAVIVEDSIETITTAHKVSVESNSEGLNDVFAVLYTRSKEEPESTE